MFGSGVGWYTDALTGQSLPYLSVPRRATRSESASRITSSATAGTHNASGDASARMRARTAPFIVRPATRVTACGAPLRGTPRMWAVAECTDACARRGGRRPLLPASGRRDKRQAAQASALRGSAHRAYAPSDDRLRAEHDEVYWPSWPSLQLGSQHQRQQPLTPAERHVVGGGRRWGRAQQHRQTSNGLSN